MILKKLLSLASLTKSITFPFSTPKKQISPHDYIYGVNPVQAALHANRRQHLELLISDSDRIELTSKVAKMIHLARDRKIPVVLAPKHKLSRIVDDQPHQNVVLKCSKLTMEKWKDEGDLPKGISVYCDKITDPQNFGAVLRSALFFGVSAVFTGKKHHCPLNSTVSKTSAGALELLQIYAIANNTDFVQKWQAKGGTVIATGIDLNKPHTTAQEIRSVLEKEGKTSILLILGSEGAGVSQHLLSASDFTVAIQRKGPSQYPYSVVDSLNVSAAASTLLFELTRD